MNTSHSFRRKFLRTLGLAGGALAVAPARAHHTDSHFGDDTKHKIVYQLNKAEAEYHRHVLFSVSELMRKYGDDIQLVVAAFGEGIHILGKKPARPVADDVKDKVSSLADYGVKFHACGNTMKALKWTKQDILPFAKWVPIGVDDIMLLQEKGFKYFSW
jgi:intracellular sulfur oxidation DsrE/DsrF family protein